jgi:hypothetical protein
LWWGRDGWKELTWGGQDRLVGRGDVVHHEDPSACGGGAGGALSVDVSLAILGFADWRARSLMFVELLAASEGNILRPSKGSNLDEVVEKVAVIWTFFDILIVMPLGVKVRWLDWNNVDRGVNAVERDIARVMATTMLYGLGL